MPNLKDLPFRCPECGEEMYLTYESQPRFLDGDIPVKRQLYTCGRHRKEKIEHFKPVNGVNADRHLCQTCKYRTFKSTTVRGCSYYVVTDRLRGCDVEDCDKFSTE